MQILENVSLAAYNTFGVDAIAKRLVCISSSEHACEVAEYINANHLPFFILGGGSNILFTKDFEGLIVKNDIRGIDKVKENESTVIVRAGAGEVWHELVLWAVNQGYGGIENLSLIPGSVGAGPIQNIGAYGVELKDLFVSLEAVEIASGKIKTFKKEDCEFGYRDSVFKNRLKDKFIITTVSLQLSKHPKLNIQYGSLKEYIAVNNIEQLTVKAVSDAVCDIRSSKLPDPAKLGNSGSFFKNPIISRQQFDSLKEIHKTMVGYPVGKDEVKIAAGWLIEDCGFKGKRIGNTGSHANQALVLVNYGNASGQEIFELSKRIIDTVRKKFNIELEREVNVL